MVIHKVKSRKGNFDQHYIMVNNCGDHWKRLNFKNYFNYHHVLNIKTLMYDYNFSSYVALTYHFNLNKW